jgi:5-methyltetrahydrofolate--homocysteine methyltransferase
MISPEMFDEFVKPELAATCRRLDHPFYHLDGPGQLPHLDSLLNITELSGVQWVPGDGQPALTEWPEVYQKIQEAGKRIQLWGDFETLDILAEQLGSLKGIVLMISAHVSQEEEARAFLRKYDALHE